MENQIVQQYLVSIGCVLIGISGWILPYKWNLLRLRRTWVKMFSERINQMIPKIVGTILISIGVLITIGTILFGSLE